MAQPKYCELAGNCVSPPTLMDKLQSIFINPLAISVGLFVLLIVFAVLKPESRVASILKYSRNWSKENMSIIALVVGFIMILLPIMMPNFVMLQASVENEFSYWTAVSASQFLGIRFGVIICVGLVVTLIAGYNIFKRKT